MRERACRTEIQARSKVPRISKTWDIRKSRAPTLLEPGRTGVSRNVVQVHERRGFIWDLEQDQGVSRIAILARDYHRSANFCGAMNPGVPRHLATRSSGAVCWIREEALAVGNILNTRSMLRD
ncbi:hypothetical protein KM043_010247 [Ampulex compressa]|nr:hypothetical protein KM043_010247 [Ampulex compressa]